MRLSIARKKKDLLNLSPSKMAGEFKPAQLLDFGFALLTTWVQPLDN
jgi:hypothetical protein